MTMSYHEITEKCLREDDTIEDSTDAGAAGVAVREPKKRPDSLVYEEPKGEIKFVINSIYVVLEHI
jgi:hypothetical protein